MDQKLLDIPSQNREQPFVTSQKNRGCTPMLSKFVLLFVGNANYLVL